MYADVVMEKSSGIVVEDNHGIRHKLESTMSQYKLDRGYVNDTDLEAKDLQILCKEFKEIIKQTLNIEFPDDPKLQLHGEGDMGWL